MNMMETIEKSIKKEKVAQLTLQGGMKQLEIAKEVGIARTTVQNWQRELRPEMQRKGEKIVELLVNQKLALLKLRGEIFTRVLKSEICDENFYRQLRAAQESAKEENEGILTMQRILGKQETEVREDVWGTVLKHIQEQKREFRIGEQELANGGGEQEASGAAESSGDEGESGERVQE